MVVMLINLSDIIKFETAVLQQQRMSGRHYHNSISLADIWYMVITSHIWHLFVMFREVTIGKNKIVRIIYMCHMSLPRYIQWNMIAYDSVIQSAIYQNKSIQRYLHFVVIGQWLELGQQLRVANDVGIKVNCAIHCAIHSIISHGEAQWCEKYEFCTFVMSKSVSIWIIKHVSLLVSVVLFNKSPLFYWHVWFSTSNTCEVFLICTQCIQ